MANEEQVARLKRSVEEWNEWREENPDEDIDLSDADLRGTDLKGAHLWDANLSGADIREVDLKRASLWRSNLRSANLMLTNLYGTNLKKVDLRRADLRGAYLSRAYLDGADLFEAMIGETDFGNIDLSKAKNLEETRHDYSSTIGIDSIRLSKGNIPEKFLRGCGLSDWEIESAKLYREGLPEKELDDILYRIHDLRFHQAIQYYSVFISYSTKDQEFAQKLYDDLQKNGVRCWFAPEDMRRGQKVHEQIDTAIRRQERLLLILSESSMNSEWVKTEIAKARKKEMAEKRRVLFPIGLVPFEKIKEWECFDADMGKDSAREVREYFIPDFSQWEEEKVYRPAFEKLLGDLLAKE